MELHLEIKDLYDVEIDKNSQSDRITGNLIIKGNLDGNDVLVKVLNNDFHSDHLGFELLWQSYLADSKINTPKIYRSRNNRYFESVNINDKQKTVFVMEKIDGNVLNSIKPNKDIVENLGSETAKMHNLSESFLNKYSNIKLLEWDKDPYMRIGEQMAKNKQLAENASKIISRVKKLSKNTDNYGIVHSDLQLHNLILNKNKLYFIDFESVIKHWFIVDFVSSLEGFESNGFGNVKGIDAVKEFTTTYFKGYTQLRSVSSEVVERIPLFYTLWQIVLYNDLTSKWDMQNLSAKRQKWITSCEENIMGHSYLQEIDFHKLID